MQDETRRMPLAEPAPPTIAEPAVSTPLLEAIRAKHGHGPLSDLLYTAELKHRREAVERYRSLQARVTELTTERSRREQEGLAALEPLQAAMDRAADAFRQSSEAYDRQRIANQGKLVSIANEVEMLTRELHRSSFSDRVKNWGVPDWYVATPEVPPLEPDWTKK